MTETRTLELDLCGSVCPGPTVETLQALKTLAAGDRLVVVTDYLPARQTIPRLLDERGLAWRLVEEDGARFRIEITKEG